MPAITALLAFAITALAPAAAFAYVGPGAGLGAIGSVLAFLGVVVLLVAGFFWYPVKRLLRKMKGGDASADTAQRHEDT